MQSFLAILGSAIASAWGWLVANRLAVAKWVLGALLLANAQWHLVPDETMTEIVGIAAILGIHVAGTATGIARQAHARVDDHEEEFHNVRLARPD